MNRALLFLAIFLAWPLAPVRGENGALTIRRILINRKNVFETGSPVDNRFPYSWANKLHIVTRETYIHSELLFKEGDPFDRELIEESERLLRSRSIFRYVRITPLEPENGQVDVIVETEDVWTTAVDASFSLAGGKSSYRFGVHEQNFLGTGKTVGAFMRKDIDRTTRGLSYRDPQFFGSRWELFGGYGRDEKGREIETHMERPFYSARTRHSEGVSFRDNKDEDRLFENGDEVAHFRHRTRELRMFAAYAVVAARSRVRRLTLAHERNSDEFSGAAGLGAPRLPAERRVNPLLAGIDFQNVRYLKARGVTTFDRDEDINLGGEWSIEAGPSPVRFGATRDGWVGRLTAGKNFYLKHNFVWLNGARAEARDERGGIRNGVLRARSYLYALDWLPKHTASLRADITLSKNLDSENEFLLGGETGLRGYSVRQFSGSNRALFALENRRVVLYDWLHLISVGWALFADTGAVWDQEPSPALRRFRSDIGGGLRFAPSRSVDPGLIRMDLAYALDDNRRSSRLVFSIGADLSFGEKRMHKFDQ